MPLTFGVVELLVRYANQLTDSIIKVVLLDHCGRVSFLDSEQGHCHCCVTGISGHDQTTVGRDESAWVSIRPWAILHELQEPVTFGWVNTLPH